MRSRPVAYRAMMELLYGEGDHLQLLDDGRIQIDIGKTAREVNARPMRFIQGLEWLHEIGLITEIVHSYRNVTVRLKRPRFTDTQPIARELKGWR